MRLKAPRPIKCFASLSEAKPTHTQTHTQGERCLPKSQSSCFFFLCEALIFPSTSRCASASVHLASSVADKASDSWKSPTEEPSIFGKLGSWDFKAPLWDQTGWKALNVAAVCHGGLVWSANQHAVSSLFNSKKLLLTHLWLLFLHFHSYGPVFLALTLDYAAISTHIVHISLCLARVSADLRIIDRFM